MTGTYPQLDSKIIAAFKELDTTCISDALDRLGLTGGLEGIKPLISDTVICGQAFTVRYIPCGAVNGGVGDFLDDVAPGQVVVIDNGGRTHCTVWGDLMSITAQIRGIEGTIIDGVCRDIPAIKKEGYPLFTKGYYMVTGKDRIQIDGINVPVTVSGVQVRPGDIVMGDGTGAIIIPYERAEEVLSIAKEINEKEAMIEQNVRGGLTLREARAKVNYHSLQKKITTNNKS